MRNSSWGRFRNARGSKHGNIKTVVDGLTFDSKAEATYYTQLKLRKRAGEIIDFKCQEPFELIPAFVDAEGYKHRPITYRADFVVYHNGLTEIVDVKGHRTHEFTLKWKMLKYRYGQKNSGYRFTIVNAGDV